MAHEFDVLLADSLAQLESYNKHLYRPNTYLHKWWARRCGSTFRAILKHLVTDERKQDYYSPGGLEGKIILDPMMGGGTTLHEAIRLGANVVGADIDPIPILQARASLSSVPLKELAEAFHKFYVELHNTLSHFYQTTCPHCASSHEWQFMLYALKRHCDCQEVLTVDSLILRHNSDDSVIHIEPNTHAIFQDEQLIAESSKGENIPLVEKSVGRCNRCQQPYQEDLTLPYYKRYRPIVAVGKCPKHGKFFKPIGRREHDAWLHADKRRDGLNFAQNDFEIIVGPKSKSLLDKHIPSYLDIFSSRQLLILAKVVDILPQFDPLIRLNLALLVSTSLEFNSLLCGYKGAKKSRPGAIRHAFAHHAYSFPYTAAENNPLYPKKASGNFQNLFHSRIARGRKWAIAPEERKLVNGRPQKVKIGQEQDIGKEYFRFDDLTEGQQRFMLLQGSSAKLALPDNCVDYVVTDPPYFDSVQYSDLAAYFRVWLKQFLPTAVGWQYELDATAVDQQTNGNGQYERVLGDIFSECHRVLKNDGRLIFTFHHWNPKGWSGLTKSLKRAGFKLIHYYVIHAENLSSVHISNQKALLHDVIFVLAPVETELTTKWNLPGKIEMEDSKRFCQDCATVLGWMLDQEMADEATDSNWIELLSNNT